MPRLHESCAPTPPQSFYLLISFPFSISMCGSSVHAFTGTFFSCVHLHTEAQGLCGNYPLFNHSSTLYVEAWSIHGTQSLPRWLLLLASVLRGTPSPPSEAGPSGGPKRITSVYEFPWVVGSKLWQELFPPGCLPSPSRVICSFLPSQWSLLFPTAETSSLLHLPSYSSGAPETTS